MRLERRRTRRRDYVKSFELGLHSVGVDGDGDGDVALGSLERLRQ
jgi:hypothetical protein